MAKELSAYQQACKEVKGFDIMGYARAGFAKKLSRALPKDEALPLLKKFKAALDADGREARRKGGAFDAANFGDRANSTSFDERWAKRTMHKEKCARPTGRDRYFAAQLPKELRKAFFDVAKDHMEYEYEWGASTTSHNRNMRHIDEILASPGGEFYWNVRNNIATARRFEMGG